MALMMIPSMLIALLGLIVLSPGECYLWNAICAGDEVHIWSNISMAASPADGSSF